MFKINHNWKNGRHLIRFIGQISLCLAVSLSVCAQNEKKSMIKEQLQVVDFCEMIKNPETYFEKNVRITAEFAWATEGVYLQSRKCSENTAARIGIGVNSQLSEADKKAFNQFMSQMGKAYNGKANVMLLGVLRNQPSLNPFAPYDFRFDISLIEQVTPLEIKQISFCEMVRNPQLYFDRIVKVKALYTQADEGAYLSDDRCPLSHDDEVGVDFDDDARANNMKKVRQISSPEFGSKAIVTIVGILRNLSRKDFIWYGSLFEISDIQTVSHVVTPYAGSLDGGITYRAHVKYDKNFGLALSVPVRMQPEYAVRFEWINLKEFPELRRLRKNTVKREIVFSVISNQIKQVSEKRWDVKIQCKIIRIE